ncbi:hypothetical protein ACTFIR_012328 [Dictyostelium discoideum]
MKEIYKKLFKLINNRPIFKDINNGSYYYNNKIEAPISIKIKNELLSVPCLPFQLNEIISNNNSNSLNSDSIEILKNKIYENELNQALNNIKNGLGIKINEEITLKLNKLVIQNSKDFEELSGKYNLSFGEEWKAQDDEIMNDYSIDDYDANESSDTDEYIYDGLELEDKIRTYNIQVIILFKRNQIFQVIEKFNKDSKNLSKNKQCAIDYLLDLEKVQTGIIGNEQGANLILDLLKLVKPIARYKDNSYIPSWFNKSIKEIAPNQVEYIKKERLQHFKLYPLEFIKNLKSGSEFLNHFTEQDIIESINNLKESIGSSDNVDSIVYIYDHYLLTAHKLNPDKVIQQVLEIFIQEFPVV